MKCADYTNIQNMMLEVVLEDQFYWRVRNETVLKKDAGVKFSIG
jgi:hypothetical protein